MNIDMRKQYILTTEYLSDKDERVVTLLGDIGVFSFNNIKKKHPNQVHNLGILEPASIGIAAGLASIGYIPFFHTIAPFVVERPYEQLKDDFAYQGLGGNFVSVGASYDDGALGTTHYCPGDIPLLKCLPNMQIVIPGTSEESDHLMRSEYDNGFPTYFRLTTTSNQNSMDVKFGTAIVVKAGKKATIIAVGIMLDMVMKACSDLDVTVLYYTTLTPFDYKALSANCSSGKVLVCEPYYSGGITNDVIEALRPARIAIEYVGVPHQFLTCYGTREEIDEVLDITPAAVRRKAEALMQLL